MDGGGSVEGMAVELDTDRIEIYEPALEKRLRHRLQRRVHPPVQLDFVVQCPKHCRDGSLLGKLRHAYRNWVNEITIQRRLSTAGIESREVERPEKVTWPNDAPLRPITMPGPFAKDVS